VEENGIAYLALIVGMKPVQNRVIPSILQSTDCPVSPTGRIEIHVQEISPKLTRSVVGTTT
jgi:hypothetical protein